MDQEFLKERFDVDSRRNVLKEERNKLRSCLVNEEKEMTCDDKFCGREGEINWMLKNCQTNWLDVKYFNLVF